MLKKANRYLILHRCADSQIAFAKDKPKKPKFHRREVSGEEAIAFIQHLENPDGYEIYELKGKPLRLATQVKVVTADEVLAKEIGDAEAGENGGK